MGYLKPQRGRAAAKGSALGACCLAILALTAPAPAEAQDPQIDWAYKLAHELMSPFCPGRTLAECPSPNAGELRLWIINQAAAGASEDEVRAMLQERFGDVLLAAPRAEGWGLSAYAIPIFFFIAGLPVVFWIIRRLMQPGSAPPTPVAVSPTPMGSIDPDLERQLERELGES
jgi:cytochrome c-type biogenesis protein CcmH/NrfF